MVCFCVLLVMLVSVYFLQSRPVYLVDFYCYRAPDRCVCSQHRLPNMAASSWGYTRQTEQHERQRSPCSRLQA